ncbi:MAG: hypothetical protein KTR28_05100 [Micavibrio sp.]|nr:hypothetical protein [Micavibrio sp.]
MKNIATFAFIAIIFAAPLAIHAVAQEVSVEETIVENDTVLLDDQGNPVIEDSEIYPEAEADSAYTPKDGR